MNVPSVFVHTLAFILGLLAVAYWVRIWIQKYFLVQQVFAALRQTFGDDVGVPRSLHEFFLDDSTTFLDCMADNDFAKR